MEMQQLRCFLTVAETLHFGRAAERLHLTPSPVSCAIKELEGELGTDLFVRRYHQVELTPVGRVLVEPAQRIVEGFDGFKALAARAAGVERRSVRIGGTYLAPATVLDRFVALVEGIFPHETADVTMAPSSELLPDLERGQLHAALVHVPLERPGLDWLVVARYTFVFVMRADDPLASAESLSLADVTERTLTVGPPSPPPVVMNQLYADLRRAGIHKLHQMPEVNTAAMAAHVRRTRGSTLTLNPKAAGPARVFDDPAFAVGRTGARVLTPAAARKGEHVRLAGLDREALFDLRVAAYSRGLLLCPQSG
jgi:DNA-binding transcriptional LysR family regulator